MMMIESVIIICLLYYHFEAGSSKLSTGAIIGICVAAAVVLAAVITLPIVLIKMKKQKTKSVSELIGLCILLK
jgi:uncharacterized membrane protein